MRTLRGSPERPSTGERRLARPSDVLVVDDEDSNRDLLRRRLRRAGFSSRTAGSAAAARAAIEESVPDLLLLDILMPGTSGLDFLEELRASEATRELPVILVSGQSGSEDVVRGLSLGANDYVVKPVDFAILLARMRTHLRLSRVLRQVRLQQDILKQLVAVDELTEVYNRRGLLGAFETCRSRPLDEGTVLAVLMLDIDHFKQVNDENGHLAGDAVLTQVARRIQRALRPTDIVGRWGGEEFCVVLSGIRRDEAAAAAERVRQRIAAEPFEIPGGSLHVTLSAGVATTPRCDVTLESLQAAADAALYGAKAAGRNRVVVSGC